MSAEPGKVVSLKPQQQSFGNWPVSQFAYSFRKSGKLWTPESLDRRQHVNAVVSGRVDKFESWDEPGTEDLGLKYHITVLDAKLAPRCENCGSEVSL